MKVRKLIIIPLIFLMIFNLIACDKKNEQSAVKLKVNGKVISTEEYDKRLSQMREMYEAQNGADIWEQEIEPGKNFTQYLEDMVLDTMILEIVLEEEAIKAGIEIENEEVDDQLAKSKEYFPSEDEYNKFLKDSGMTEELLRETLRKEILIEKFLTLKSEDIDKLKPSDAELKALYEDRKSTFDTIEASHILLEDEDEAKKIKERIDKGEDFAELAREFSICPSNQEGGNLGYFSRNEMAKEFSDIAFNMEIGQISDPVETQFGFHIIKLTDKKTTYEDADHEELAYQFKALKYNEMLDKFIENARIEK